ncbi:MAG: hypothetical protein A2W25_06820 [candidate division Zixibacteria bacterium RBG_16_53_22]|nr:MAG: hypothetical protein A2W25_06820 [candidate division Zixibacteria bacterium RBG_16_53_22]
MPTYAFAVPILPDKTEDLKRYAREMTGPRLDEYKNSSRNMGIDVEQFWLQHTPDGDMLVVVWKTDNPAKIFKDSMVSNDPYDKWFREKVIVECFGINPSDFDPPLNEVLVDFNIQSAGKKIFEDAKRK